MSHLKERTEKVCLNCHASLYGRYCHLCGQENLEPKETVWHLVTHFFNDITHFDGKFFQTVKLLIAKPGFLSKEYMLGRRASYLNPIRMYVFTSAFFFLIFFALRSGDKVMTINESPDKASKSVVAQETIQGWEKQKIALEKKIVRLKNDDDLENSKDSLAELTGLISAAKKKYGDTSTRNFSEEEIALLSLQANMDSLRNAGLPGDIAAKIDRAANRDAADSDSGVWDNYKTVSAYDSAQQKLPDYKKDGWFKRLFNRKIIAVTEVVRKDKQSYFEHFKENFVHSFPKILFISLPFFALILKLVYIRRKQFYYADHGIFAIHLYCAIFILLLGLIVLNKLTESFSWPWLKTVALIIDAGVLIYIFIYTYKAMRIFYRQRRIKTMLKYCIVGFLAFMVNLIIMLIFLLISAISV